MRKRSIMNRTQPLKKSHFFVVYTEADGVQNETSFTVLLRCYDDANNNSSDGKNFPSFLFILSSLYAHIRLSSQHKFFNVCIVVIKHVLFFGISLSSDFFFAAGKGRAREQHDRNDEGISTNVQHILAIA